MVMKFSMGKTAAVLLTMLMLVQAAPSAGTNAAGTNSLHIHPYVFDKTNMDKYTQAKNSAYEEQGDAVNDKAQADSYGVSENTVMTFNIKQINENGTDVQGGFTKSNCREATGMPDGFYLIDPVDSSTDSAFSEADAFVIKIPAVNAGVENRDVSIYPKLIVNEENTQTPSDTPQAGDTHYVVLTKKDNSTPAAAVANAEYEVYFKDAAGNWKCAMDGDSAKVYKTDSAGKITITGLPVGDYWFVETKAPSGYLLDQKPVPFKITGQSAQTNVSAVNDKVLELTNEIAGDGAGDKYNWVIRADVPSKTENLISYVITDTFTGLDTSAGNKITVSIPGMTEGTDYIVSDTGSSPFTITLTDTGISKLTPNQSIVINISSKISLQNGQSQVENKADIAYKYAYDPGENADLDIPAIKIISPAYPAEAVYPPSGNAATEETVIPKVFTISNRISHSSTEEIPSSKYTISEESFGNYSWNLEDTDDASSSHNKLAEIVNFAPGRYKVVQTEVPAGYVLDENPRIIRIGADGKMYLITRLQGDGNELETEVSQLEFINRESNFALPFTGTTSAYVYVITGVCLMFAAGSVLLIVMRKREG